MTTWSPRSYSALPAGRARWRGPGSTARRRSGRSIGPRPSSAALRPPAAGARSPAAPPPRSGADRPRAPTTRGRHGCANGSAGAELAGPPVDLAGRSVSPGMPNSARPRRVRIVELGERQGAGQGNDQDDGELGPQAHRPLDHHAGHRHRDRVVQHVERQDRPVRAGQPRRLRAEPAHTHPQAPADEGGTGARAQGDVARGWARPGPERSRAPQVARLRGRDEAVRQGNAHRGHATAAPAPRRCRSAAGRCGRPRSAAAGRRPAPRPTAKKPSHRAKSAQSR